MATDNVNHPEHYADKCSVECIDAMLAILGPDGLAYGCLMNVIKYLWRYKYKNGSEDLAKAQWYMNKAVQLLNDYDDTFFCVDTVRRVEAMFNKVYVKGIREC